MIKKEWCVGRRGGSGHWPPWIAQLSCELLVVGASPSAIPTIIQVMAQSMWDVKVVELPLVNYVRECRVVVQIIGEALAAYRLGKAKSWWQAFSDATTRRQTPFQNLLISLDGADGELDPFVVSSCIYLNDETSVTTADSITSKVCIWIVHFSFNFFQLKLIYY